MHYCSALPPMTGESAMLSKSSQLFAACVLSCCAAAVPAQPAADAAALNARPDNAGTGPYAAMKEEDATLPAHVVYRPRDLDALGNQKLGVVAWGNGGCSADGASSRFHLLELASHGFLVIAPGQIYSGPGAHARPVVPEGQQPPRTNAADLIAAVNWALRENARAGGQYEGRIDPEQIALAGFSCGG